VSALDRNAEHGSQQQTLANNQPSNANTTATTRSSRLATISTRMREIFSLISAQSTEDFDQYAECLELVWRGLDSGRVHDMVEHLRSLLDEPSNVVDIPSCQLPAANGNLSFIISVI